MYVLIYWTEEDGEDITIGFEEYHEIKNLSFAPEVDLIGASVPINEFSAEIVTSTMDKIKVGHWCELYDDDDNKWASYWLTYAERVDAKTVKVIAKSPLCTLDYVNMPETVYENADASTVIISCIEAGGEFGPGAISIDSSFTNATINGYCPPETARERLTAVLFAIGAYAKSCFSDTVDILPIDATETQIPIEDTYWKPTVTFKDWVTALKVTAYTFTRAESEQAWANDPNSLSFPYPWVATTQEFTLQNPSVPSGTPENIVYIDGVYLINTSNVSSIMTIMSQRYFKRIELDADVINNGTYAPGDRVIVYADEETLYSGYIESAGFVFGLQARSAIKLTACESRAGAKLIVNYIWSGDGRRLGRHVYYLPVGYPYTIQTLYLDKNIEGHRYIFRPTTETISGTLTSAGATVTVSCEVALDLYKGVLHVISVDEITTVTEDGQTIGVIS